MNSNLTLTRDALGCAVGEQPDAALKVFCCPTGLSWRVHQGTKLYRSSIGTSILIQSLEPSAATATGIAPNPIESDRITGQWDVAVDDVTVVIPCYNSAAVISRLEERLGILLTESRRRTPGFGWSFLFVDDGSQDASYDALQRSFAHWPNVQIIRHAQHRGLIATLQTEFHRCASKWVAVLDPAGPYDPVLLIDIVDKADREGYDAVTASPRQGSGTAGNAASWGGTLLRVTSWLYRWSMRNQLSCYTSAVSVYTASWVKQRKLIHRGRVGLTELLWQLDCLGARIGEVPATLAPRLAGWSTEVATGTLFSHLRLLASIAGQRLWGEQPASRMLLDSDLPEGGQRVV